MAGVTVTAVDKLRSMWRVALVLAVLLAIPRFYWMLSNQYGLAIVIFVLMALIPFVLLGRPGRSLLGFSKCRWAWVGLSFLLGAGAAITIYLVGLLLFAESDPHWYRVIMDSFNQQDIIAQIKPSVFLFLLFALPSLIFSPVGEEFFFRGFLHESVALRWGGTPALALDASLFGVVHLAHYGLYYEQNSLAFRPHAFTWVLLMGATAVLFYFVKKKSGSLWAAVCCHAGFNLAMMACIVYLIH
jgi:hypothetical protein